MTKSRHHLARHVDEEKIAAALKDAEAQTTGKIVVTLSPHIRGDVGNAAQRASRRLGMHHVPQRNGVLIFVIPARREFAVVGDAGIHGKAGQEFWDRLVAAMSATIKSQDLTSGLVHGIEETGRELHRHFPKSQRT